MTRRELSAVIIALAATLWACVERMDRRDTRRTLERIKSQAVERGYASDNPFRWEVGR